MSGTTTDVAFLTRALKMPRVRELPDPMADTARDEGWDYLEYLAKVLSEEVAARETHCGDNRINAARFPQIKTLDDFASPTSDRCHVSRWVTSTRSTSSERPTT